jgi:hypothetical protein
MPGDELHFETPVITTSALYPGGRILIDAVALTDTGELNDVSN